MLKGTLNLSHNGVDYIVFDKGNSYDISEKMNCLLMDKVQLYIEIDGKIMYSGKGRLMKQKVNGIWQFFCGKTNVDQKLWESVDKKIVFGIKSIQDESEVAQS